MSEEFFADTDELPSAIHGLHEGGAGVEDNRSKLRDIQPELKLACGDDDLGGDFFGSFDEQLEWMDSVLRSYAETLGYWGDHMTGAKNAFRQADTPEYVPQPEQQPSAPGYQTPVLPGHISYRP